MWRSGLDPEMIVKTLSSKIRKGFAEGVLQRPSAIRDGHTEERGKFEVAWCGIKHACNVLQRYGHAKCCVGSGSELFLCDFHVIYNK